MPENQDTQDKQLRFGYLKINVSIAQRALPIYNAQVAVYSDRREQQQDLLALLQTDESGDTQVIELPAPALANSLEPDQLNPYNIYYLRISAANFTTQDHVPVQVFPGIESNLVVNMLVGR